MKSAASAPSVEAAPSAAGLASRSSNDARAAGGAVEASARAAASIHPSSSGPWIDAGARNVLIAPSDRQRSP